MATSTKKLTQKKISPPKKARRHSHPKELLPKKSEEYQSLIHNIQAAVIVHGNQTQIVTSNLMAQQLLGLTEDQLLGKTSIDPAWHFICEDGTVMPVEEYPVNQVFATKKPLRDFITGIFHPETNDHTWALVNADPVLTSDGEIECVIVTFVDITEQKKTEKTKAKLVAIVESSDDAITGKTLDGIIESWNTGAERLYGYTSTEIIGKNVSLLAPSSRKNEVTEILKKIKNGERVQHFETERVRKDGTVISISLTVSPMKDASGKIIGASSISRDITEQKRTEKLLKQSEVRLNEAQRLAHIGSWEMNLTDNHLVWSDEIYSMFEIDPNRFGASYDAFLAAIHPEDRDAVNTAYSTSVKNRTPYTIDHRLLFKDGRIKYVHEQCETFYDKNGKAIRSLGTVQDVTERKRIEENLRLAHSYTRSLIEASLDPLVTISANGKITDVNEATEKVTGFSRHELIGTDFSNYFSEPEKARLGYQEVFKKGFVQDYALEIHHRKGTTTPVLYNASVYKDESGKVIGVFAAARDMTEQKKAEFVLRQSEETLKEAQRIAHLGSWHMDLATNEVVWSKVLYKIYGLEPALSPPLYTESMKLFTPESWEQLSSSIAQTTQTGIPYELELESVRQDGGRRWMWARGELVRDEQGTPVRVRGVVMDITERKRAEEALIESEEKYRLLAESSPEMIYLIKTDGCISYMNHVARLQFGISVDKLVGKHITEIFPPSIAQQNVDAIQRVIDSGKPIHHESVQQFPSGKKWVETRLSPVVDKNNRVVGVLGLSNDITERKQAEEQIQKLNDELELRVFQRTAQLEAANKELEAFAYSVSHDLRAPLRSIDGFSHILLEEYTKCIDEQGKDYLHRVRTAAQHMAQLIDDMLNLSRLTRSELNIQTFNFSEIAFAISNELHVAEPERTAEFTIQKDVYVHGDVRLLKVVVENLLRNAWKFTSKHPIAHIEFGKQEHEGREAYFVRDDGAGFDMAYTTKLFGAFQRLHTTSEFPGTGIGLATVQRIIHKHGGTLWAEGKVEQGATFYFTLP
ncbi:MAG: PAS domain S-box protein [Bacteroidota bacterium]|nr:PAS domain S-box protein [Bacteroidota bacterium]